MNNILVIDTKLMMYRQHHSRKPILNFLDSISDLALKHLPQIHKVIFVKDLGKSKRCEIFPEYKGKRLDTQDKMSSAEKNRLKKFLNIYNKCDDFLRLFGSVIALEGIEADDLASMIVNRMEGKANVFLLSGDEDWSRFLTLGNATMLHPQREKLISLENAEEEFGVHPEYKLLVDSVTGVDKESVDGITKLGKVRAVTILKEMEYHFDGFIEMLNIHIETKKWGLKLPDWAKDAREVYERNSKIFETHTFESLTDIETVDFLTNWYKKPKRDFQEIVKTSASELSGVYVPSFSTQKFFNLQNI